MKQFLEKLENNLEEAVKGAPPLEVLGTLRYSGCGRGGRQQEVKCSILGTN